MNRVPYYILCVLMFVLNAWCLKGAEILPSVLAPVFGVLFVCALTGGFKGFPRNQTVFIIFSVAYFSLALLTFGVLSFSAGVLLFAVSAALFFGRYDTMYYPLAAIGAMSLFYSLSFAASHIINEGLGGFPGMLSMRAVFYPLIAWVLVTALYGLIRMFASSGRKRYFTQEAFNAYYRSAAKYLLVFHSAAIVLMFFLNFGGSPLVVNLVPFKSISAYFTQPGGVDFSAVLSGLILNAALCLPYGFVYASFKKKRLILLTLAIAFVLSALIETGQLISGEGAFDVDDVLLHMVGFYAGMALYAFCTLLTRLFSLGRARNVFAWEYAARMDARHRRPVPSGASGAAGDSKDAWWEAYTQ